MTRKGNGALAVMVSAVTIALAAPALAATPKFTETTIADCFSGAGGPNDIVQEWTVSPTVYLRCGDPTKGVLHIESGHGPISDSNGFLTCLDRVFFSGSAIGPGKTPNSTEWDYNYKIPGGRAVAIIDNHTHNILTAYAGSGKGNAWGTCAKGS